MKMKNPIFTISLFALGIMLVGCNNSTSTSSSESSSESSSITTSNKVTSDSKYTSEENSSSLTSSEIVSSSKDESGLDLEELKARYGELNIDSTKGNEGTLSDDGKTYTISVAESKSAFTISGYFEGRIIIDNALNLTSIKGVEITLSNACLVTDSGINIDFKVEDKNVEVKAKKETENYIINLGEGYDDCAINSEKNIEIDGKGILNIITKTGHGLKASNKIRIYDALTINITSGHDAIHAKSFVANNEETNAVDYEAFTGTLNVISAVSQAFDCTTNSGTGTIDLTSGTYNISACESAFKVDVSLYIGGVVKAMNLTSEPVVKGDNSNGVTIEISETGSFTVDGVDYPNMTI